MRFGLDGDGSAVGEPACVGRAGGRFHHLFGRIRNGAAFAEGADGLDCFGEREPPCRLDGHGSAGFA